MIPHAVSLEDSASAGSGSHFSIKRAGAARYRGGNLTAQGDPRAAYAVYDSGAQMLTYFRAAYDVEAAQKRIREVGLPPVLADRLSVGR